MAPVPVIVCGQRPQIAQSVRKYLLPEYDAVHVIMSVEAGVEEIPLLLSGRAPPDTSSNLGSKNYDAVPKAVVLGGGFDDAAFQKMHDACKKEGAANKVPWLRVDMTQVRAGQKAATKPPSAAEFDAFAADTAERVKKCLEKEDVKGEGVWLY